MEEEGELNELTQRASGAGRHAKDLARFLMSPHVTAFHTAQQFSIRVNIIILESNSGRHRGNVKGAGKRSGIVQGVSSRGAD